MKRRSLVRILPPPLVWTCKKKKEKKKKKKKLVGWGLKGLTHLIKCVKVGLIFIEYNLIFMSQYNPNLTCDI
jgi:hypothetical protein